MNTNDYSNFSTFFFQNGDNYLFHLASRYAHELTAPYLDVLQQLEDLRLAEWSDHAPLAPPAPTQAATSANSARSSMFIQPQRNYVNFPSAFVDDRTIRARLNGDEPIYAPGQYQVKYY